MPDLSKDPFADVSPDDLASVQRATAQLAVDAASKVFRHGKRAATTMSETEIRAMAELIAALVGLDQEIMTRSYKPGAAASPQSLEK